MAFAGSSFASWAVEFALLSALYTLTGALVASAVVARLVGCAVNFVINRRIVFHHDGNPAAVLGGYAAVQGASLLMNTAALALLVDVLGASLTPAKIAVDLTLFAFSFTMQRFVVFAGPRTPRPQVPSAVTLAA